MLPVSEIVVREPGPDAPRSTPALFGQFIENLGRLLHGGVLAESGSESPSSPQGWRLDVLDALKELAPCPLRWPGGCYADEYRWRDGIGADRPLRPNLTWRRFGRRFGTPDDHRFGTLEYLAYCRQAGAAPLINANMGTAPPEEAGEWAAFIREARGTDPTLPEVSTWGLGNEQFGFWNFGHSGPAQYARRANLLRAGIARVDPAARFMLVGADEHYPAWNRAVLAGLDRPPDFLSLHVYLPLDFRIWNAFNLRPRTERRYWSLVGAGERVQEKLDRMSREIDDAGLGSRTRIALDEWNFHWTPRHPVFPACTWREGLAAATVFNTLLRNAGRVGLACLSSLANVLVPPILTDRDRMVRTSMFRVNELYRRHGIGRVIPVEVISGPTFDAPRWGGLGGQARLPVLHVAAIANELDEPGAWKVFLVNRDPRHLVEARLEFPAALRAATICTLDAASIDAADTVRDGEAARVYEASVEPAGRLIGLRLPAASVNVLRLSSAG